MMRLSYFLVFAISSSGFKLGGGASKIPHPRFYENPTKKSPATKVKFHPARGRGPIRGWLIKVFVEFQHKITLVVEPRGQSLVILSYSTMAAMESTSVISVLLYMTVVEVSSFLVACGKRFIKLPLG